jgi:hypothetical protein
VNLTTDEQKLIENDNIYIPIVNGSSSSKSAIGAESLAIKPYEYLDTLGDIDNVTVTLDTDYPEVWWGLLEEYIDQGMVSISNQTKKITITTDVAYLKLPDQTASGSLHAGMISCTVEDPDGGEEGDGLWLAGEGTDIMATGTRVANLPSSANATEIKVSNIIYNLDPVAPESLDDDMIQITITDSDGNWWRVVITFKTSNDVVSIVAKAGTPTTTRATSTYSYPSPPFTFDETTIIDLLSMSHYDPTDSCYQNAGIGDTNVLVTYLGDGVSLKKGVLICYRLTIM